MKMKRGLESRPWYSCLQELTRMLYRRTRQNIADREPSLYIDSLHGDTNSIGGQYYG